MIQTPELQNKIAQWRARQEKGEMSTADWLEAFTTLRQHRTGAQDAAAASRKRAPKAPVDLNALKDSLKAFAKKPV